MFKAITAAIFALGIQLSSASASAAVIVDTGPGYGSSGSGTTAGFSLFSGQWLAERFSLSSETVLTDVFGWITAFSPGRTAHVSIYTDAGVPGTKLFTQQFTVNGPDTGFFGVSGVNWDLAANNYFVAFEVTGSDTMNGGMPTGENHPTDLGTAYTSNGIWKSSMFLLGAKILGEPATVPEPTTTALLGLGLLGFIASRRKTKKSHKA